ncbi:lipid II flippase family protein [Brevundimonas albigilva]|uniref:DUF2837 family protein n=1 Tax=Brevundimonas albigilva TaxID=1312364 RepID=A0ABY4SLT4_9CAUL|nr:DUF2837 family protein [Brevundimonas albigilva]URI15030.1 DUF2837 family protein [Brevundimonas albigilva]
MLYGVAVAAVCVCFFGYALLECGSIIVRTAAAHIGMNAAGAAFEKILSAVKRTFIFLYPPILGALLSAGRIEEMYASIFLSCLCGLLACALVFALRARLSSWFVLVISEFGAGKSAVSAILHGVKSLVVIQSGASSDRLVTRVVVNRLDPRVIAMSAWVYFTYSSSIFLVNCIAAFAPQYNAVILQSVGFFNGLGTIMLALLLDPILARNLDSRNDLEASAEAIIGGQAISYGVLSPLLFGLLFLISDRQV